MTAGLADTMVGEPAAQRLGCASERTASRFFKLANRAVVSGT
jgi:hypothetical protein